MAIFISEHSNLIRMNFGTQNYFKRCRVPPFLSTPFILHSVTTRRTSNTHRLVVGMTVHEILEHMYICMHGSLLDHVPHDYCTLET